MVVLIIHREHETFAEGPSKLKFKTFEEAANHARMLIIPQLADVIDDSVEDSEKNGIDGEMLETATDLLRELYNSDESRVIAACDNWAQLAEQEGLGDYWVEWVS